MQSNEQQGDKMVDKINQTQQPDMKKPRTEQPQGHTQKKNNTTKGKRKVQGVSQL